MPQVWKWSKQKRIALEMYMAGVSQTSIAKELGFHRNSVGNWINHPEFIAELKIQLSKKQTNSKLRRIHAVQNIRTRLERMANGELKSLEEGLKRRDPSGLRVARELLAEYRYATNEERVEQGEAEKRIHVTDDRADPSLIESAPATAQNLKEALLEAGRRGLIDVRAIMASGSPQKAFQEACQQILTHDPRLLESIHAEKKTDEEEL